MPMVVHWIVVRLGARDLLCSWPTERDRETAGYAIPVGALAGFIVWRAGTEIRNYVVLPPRPYPGRAALREIEGHSAVTLWISSAVSAYTRQWAASLNNARWAILRMAICPSTRVAITMSSWRRPETIHAIATQSSFSFRP